MNLGRFHEAELLWRDFFAYPEAAEDKDLRQNASFVSVFVSCWRGARTICWIAQILARFRVQADLLALKSQALIQTKNWEGARMALKNGMERFPKQTLFSHAAQAIPRRTSTSISGSKKGSRQVLVQRIWKPWRISGPSSGSGDKCLQEVVRASQASNLRSVDLLLTHANALDQLDRITEATQFTAKHKS